MGLTKNQELFQATLMKVWQNPELKKDLVARPEETIKRITGESFELPEGKELVIIDRSDESKVYVNIPAKSVPAEDVELSDEELEKVAGGTLIPDTGIIDSCFDDCTGGGGLDTVIDPPTTDPWIDTQ